MRVKRLFSWLIVLSLVMFNCSLAFAKSIEEEVAELKSKISALEQKLSQQEGKIGKQEELSKDLEKIKEAFEGLNISASITLVTQGTHNANGDNQLPKEDVLDASYSLDLTLEKAFEDYGKAFSHLEAGKGEGVEDELKLLAHVNIL